MRNLTSSIKSNTWIGILVPLVAIYASKELTAQAPVELSENCNKFDPNRIQTKIPNRNSHIREGVL